MKKQYITPSSEAIVLSAESMLATSSPKMGVRDDVEIEAGNAYSNRQNAWDNSLWNTSDK